MMCLTVFMGSCSKGVWDLLTGCVKNPYQYTLFCNLLGSLFDRNSDCNMSSGMTGTAAYCYKAEIDYLEASSIATATATVIPTMGLLPISVAQEITSK
jgi:hypothetical protein